MERQVRPQAILVEVSNRREIYIARREHNVSGFLSGQKGKTRKMPEKGKFFLLFFNYFQ